MSVLIKIREQPPAQLGIDPYKIGRAIRGLTEWQKHVQTESDIDRDISVAVEALKAQLGTDCIQTLKELPSAEPTFDARDTQYNLPIGTDCISRQQAVDALRKMQTYKLFSGDDMLLIDQAGAQTELMLLPPAQPLEDIHREKEQAYYCGYEDGKAAQWDWLKTEIKRMKMTYTICLNHDYYTGYMSALSAVEGCIAQLEGDAE